jgi:hypothetical protein
VIVIGSIIDERETMGLVSAGGARASDRASMAASAE